MTMRYRLLGGTDLSVSVIGLGTWQYGGEWGITYTEGDVALIVDKAEELGVNLMRLGQSDEAFNQLQICYNNEFRDAATVNSLRLMDTYKNFVTFTTPTTRRADISSSTSSSTTSTTTSPSTASR